MFEIFNEQNLNLFVTRICEAESFTVVKSSVSHIGIDDPTYFSDLQRIEQFSRKIGQPVHLSTYHGTLFMWGQYVKNI